MEDSTKKKLEKAGKIFLGIAEAGASSMQSTAKSYSKNKKLPEAYREKYSEMAEGLGEVKNSLHDYKERIGTSCNNDDYYEDDDYEDDDYEDECEDDTICENEEVIDNTIISQPKNYSNLEKANQQANSATMVSVEYNQLSESLDNKWKTLGYLKDIDCDKLSEDRVGIVRLLVDNKVVYIVRAIELNNGGITKKIKDLQENSAKRKTKVYTEIRKNIEKIKVEIICVGNDDSAVANSRKLEKELLQEYNPIWL